MMWYWGGGGHWWWALLGLVGMVAFWGLIIWAVWYFVTGTGRGADPQQAPGGARRILDERLARGEIDADEYRHLVSLISDDNVHARNGQSPARTGSQR
jgi:putative membrane protein